MAQKFSCRLTAMKWSHILQKYAFFIMQTYLTNIWGLDFIHAAGILNVWEGIQRILPLPLLYVADHLIGDAVLVKLSTVANSIGVAFIAMSTPPVLASVTGTCKEYKEECIGHAQKVIFYMGMGLIAIGLAGGRVITLRSKDKGDDEGPSLCGYIWKTFLIIIAPRFLAVVLPYISKENFSVHFGIPAVCTAVATLFLLTGLSSLQKKQDPTGKPVTIVPEDHQQCDYTETRSPETLEQAAIIITDEGEGTNRMKLSSVVKIARRLFPLWLPCAICGIVCSNGNTFFVEQTTQSTSPHIITISAFLSIIEFNALLMDASLEAGIKDFFEDESPLSVDNRAGLLARAVIGIGFILSVALVQLVDHFTHWFQPMLSESRLDNYYWFLTGLSTLNLILFMFASVCTGRSGAIPPTAEASEQVSV